MFQEGEAITDRCVNVSKWISFQLVENMKGQRRSWKCFNVRSSCVRKVIAYQRRRRRRKKMRNRMKKRRKRNTKEYKGITNSCKPVGPYETVGDKLHYLI